MKKGFIGGDGRIGLLGGGQLGRMMIREAIDMDMRVYVLDPSKDCSCKEIASGLIVGDFKDFHTVMAFGREMDVVTVEIEHVNTDALRQLKQQGKMVYPDPGILEMIRDKGTQKEFFSKHNIPTSAFRLVDGKKDISQFPVVQKLRTGGYDGRGVQILRSESDISKAFDAPSVLEDLVDIKMEIAVMVARGRDGSRRVYPAVEMVFDPEANLVDNLVAPARIDSKLCEKAEGIALNIAETLDYVGVLAVEMFITGADEILVNEMAPRPHNSGHHTMEAAVTSQFEQHLRAVCGLPLGSTELRTSACMVNILGADGFAGKAVLKGAEEVLNTADAYLHLYGKAETRPKRKMGHITVLANSPDDAYRRAMELKGKLRMIAE
jgi:5-(carboxyamino)imidazole ribonucleotide synthase